MESFTLESLKMNEISETGYIFGIKVPKPVDLPQVYFQTTPNE